MSSEIQQLGGRDGRLTLCSRPAKSRQTDPVFEEEGEEGIWTEVVVQLAQKAVPDNGLQHFVWTSHHFAACSVPRGPKQCSAQPKEWSRETQQVPHPPPSHLPIPFP